MHVLLERRNSEGWDKAVAFAKERYSKSYRANINPSPEYYLIVKNESNSIQSCAGVWIGSEQKLFSENYLEEPCHRIISRLEKKVVDRKNIAEVGSVASVRPAAGRVLFDMLSLVTWCLGANYLICTSNPRTIKVMDQCNVPFVPLCKANMDHVPNEPGIDWGDYYKDGPITGYIDLRGMQNHYQKMLLQIDFDFTSQHKGF